MGQSTSKGLSKVAEKVAKHRTTEELLKRPPIPSRTPIDTKNEAATAASAAGDILVNKEMPKDLLKFIQDVGPAKQSIDREFTTPRLLREENKTELDKAESVRAARRRRIRMPLMGDDTDYTTEKNTNFSSSSDSSMTTSSSKLGETTLASSTTTTNNDDIDFGLSNFELYDILSEKDCRTGNNESDTNRLIVENCYERIVSKRNCEGNDNGTSSDSSSVVAANLRKKEKLSQAFHVLDVPTLRIDSDDNILGLYPQDVPGPEIKSISTLPENKVMLVLKHLTTSQ